MRRRRRTPMLVDLSLRELFKVVVPCELDSGVLTLDGVYAIVTKKANYGKNIRLCDLASVRKEGTAFRYVTLTVPTEKASSIEVYRLTPFSRLPRYFT